MLRQLTARNYVTCECRGAHRSHPRRFRRGRLGHRFRLRPPGAPFAGIGDCHGLTRRGDLGVDLDDHGEYESRDEPPRAKLPGAAATGAATLIGSLVPVWPLFVFKRDLAPAIAAAGCMLVATWIGHEKRRRIRGYAVACLTLCGAAALTPGISMTPSCSAHSPTVPCATSQSVVPRVACGSAPSAGGRRAPSGPAWQCGRPGQRRLAGGLCERLRDVIISASPTEVLVLYTAVTSGALALMVRDQPTSYLPYRWTLFALPPRTMFRRRRLLPSSRPARDERPAGLVSSQAGRNSRRRTAAGGGPGLQQVSAMPP